MLWSLILDSQEEFLYTPSPKKRVLIKHAPVSEAVSLHDGGWHHPIHDKGLKPSEVTSFIFGRFHESHLSFLEVSVDRFLSGGQVQILSQNLSQMWSVFDICPTKSALSWASGMLPVRVKIGIYLGRN